MKKKNLINKINELVKKLEQQDFQTAQVMSQIAQFKADQARTNVLSQFNKENMGISTDLDEIRHLQIPDGYEWDYYQLLDQITDYWIGRYSNFEVPEGSKYSKQSIQACLRIGIKYGWSGLGKQDGLPYYVSPNHDGTYNCYSANYMLDFGSEPYRRITTKEGKHKWGVPTDQEVHKVIKENELVMYTRRDTHVGDFLWYMKDLLTHIYNMYAISNAVPAIAPNIICSTDGTDNNAVLENVKTMTNVRKPVKVIIKKTPFSTGKDDKYGLGGEFKIAEPMEVKGTENLILIMKTHYEEFCNKNGIPITSSKDQTLSSDANLGTYTTQCRTKALDQHVIDFFKQLNIDLQIDDPQINPQNDNADKHGGGTANTDGDKIKGDKND